MSKLSEAADLFLKLAEMSVEEAAGVLGVALDAHPDEVNLNYKTLMKKHHPDINPDPGSHQKTVELNAARTVLLNPYGHMSQEGRPASVENEVWRDVDDIVDRHQAEADDWLKDIAKRREWMDYLSGELPFEKLTHPDHIENAKHVEQRRAKYKAKQDRIKEQRRANRAKKLG